MLYIYIERESRKVYFSELETRVFADFSGKRKIFFLNIIYHGTKSLVHSYLPKLGAMVIPLWSDRMINGWPFNIHLSSLTSEKAYVNHKYFVHLYSLSFIFYFGLKDFKQILINFYYVHTQILFSVVSENCICTFLFFMHHLSTC